jgi:hypothetical protein
MVKKPVKKTNNNLGKKEIEKLLDSQTNVILTAVDERLQINKVETLDEVDKKFRINTFEIITEVDRKMEKMEIRINKKFDKLVTTLDKFLKRMTDMEDEFTIMKMDINRVKQVIKDKLGVDLT